MSTPKQRSTHKPQTETEEQTYERSYRHSRRAGGRHRQTPRRSVSAAGAPRVPSIIAFTSTSSPVRHFPPAVRPGSKNTSGRVVGYTEPDGRAGVERRCLRPTRGVAGVRRVSLWRARSSRPSHHCGWASTSYSRAHEATERASRSWLWACQCATCCMRAAKLGDGRCGACSDADEVACVDVGEVPFWWEGGGSRALGLRRFTRGKTGSG